MTNTQTMSGNNTMKKKTKKKTVEASLPDDRKILDTLYNYYGKPSNIEKEKVSLYRGYKSPAGWSQEDWVVDGFQMGRITIFTRYRSGSEDICLRTRIDKSWFIGVTSTHIKVYNGKEVDVILEV